jgi:hypothetical protein
MKIKKITHKTQPSRPVRFFSLFFLSDFPPCLFCQTFLPLKMAVFWVAASTSETLVNFYQTTRRYNPEDSHLRIHRRENLKS